MNFFQGADGFSRVVKLKILLVLRILRLGFDVIYSDVDIAILKNIFSYIEEEVLPIEDIVFLSDDYIDTKKIGGRFQYLCSGFFYAKAHGKVINKLFDVLAYLENPTNSKRDDQIAINAYFVVTL